MLAVVSPAPPSPDALAKLRPAGLLVLNREARFPHSGPFQVARVPASRIARDNGILSAEGRPMGNIALLGACVKLLLPGGLDFLDQAIRGRLGAAADANVLAAREGYARCTRQHTLVRDTELERPGPRTAPRASATSRSAHSTRFATTPARGRSTAPR